MARDKEVFEGIFQKARQANLEDFEVELEQIPPIAQKDKAPDLAEEKSDMKISPEKQARLDQIELVKNEVAALRHEYVELEHKKNSAFSRLGKFFGVYWKRDLDAPDDEVNTARNNYKGSLLKYSELLLEDAKLSQASKRELGQIAKIFAVEANLNLMDTRADVKNEHRPHWLRVGKETAEWYRGLGLVAKGAVSLGFIASGAGLAIAAKRVFTGAVAGVGIAAGLEVKDRRNIEKALNEYGQSFEDIMVAHDSSAEYEEKIKNDINRCIQEVDIKIAELRRKEMRNLTIGVLSGALLGSGAASWLAGEAGSGMYKLGEWTGINGGLSSVGQSIKGMFGGITEEVVKPEVGTVATEVAQKASLEIEAGSSVEGALIKNGISAHDAHEMASRYAEKMGFKEINLVHPGAQIELSADGQSIAAITGDEHMGYSSAIAEHAEKAVEAVNSPEAFSFDAQTLAEIEVLEQNTQGLVEHLEGMQEQLAGLDEQITQASVGSGSGDTISQLTEQKQALEVEINRVEGIHESLLSRTENGYWASLGKEFCGSKEEFMKLSNLRASEGIGDNVKVHKFMDRVLASQDGRLEPLKQFIRNAETRQESFGLWTLRVARIMAKLGIRKI